MPSGIMEEIGYCGTCGQPLFTDLYAMDIDGVDCPEFVVISTCTCAVRRAKIILNYIDDPRRSE